MGRMRRGWRMAFACLLLAQLAAFAWPAAAQPGPHHNSVAVIIGNQKYRHTTPVVYAHNDARAIEKYLVERLGFRRGNIMLRLDLGREQMETLFGEADRADGEMMDRILDRRLENRGDVFVFYSGHGVPDPDAVHDDARRAFLLPTDVRQDRIATAAFPMDRLHKKLELVRGQLPPDRRVVVMLDACFSGRTPVARATPGVDGPDASLFKFSRGSFSVRAEEPTAGVVRLVAATGDQVAYWDEQRRLGLFTSLFLRGVSGEADGAEFGNGDRMVGGDELLRFLEERVPAEARLRHQRTQRPSLDGLERFAWTPPVKAGQIVAPAALPVPVPVRAQPAAAPSVAPPPPARAARPAEEEEEEAKPARRSPKRTARAAPRPVVEEEDGRARNAAVRRGNEIERARNAAIREQNRLQRERNAAERARNAAQRERAVVPRPAAEPSGGCKVVNGVRFCG